MSDDPKEQPDLEFLDIDLNTLGGDNHEAIGFVARATLKAWRDAVDASDACNLCSMVEVAALMLALTLESGDDPDQQRAIASRVFLRSNQLRAENIADVNKMH